MAISVRPGDREWLSQDSESCRLAIIYEDANSRDTAINLCDRLLHHFRGDLNFDATWWQCRFLGDPVLAERAAAAASLADIIVVTARDPDNLAMEAKTWFEQWVVPRVQPGGALAWLPTLAEPPHVRGIASSYLEGLAYRARLDFLSLELPRNEEETYSQPAETMAIWETVATSAALEAKYHSSGWGINE